jgi:preprotein translocase subunit YajC
VRADRSGIRAWPSSVRKTETTTVLFSLLLQQQPTNSIALFAPYILIALVFYFLLFMPMQKQKKKLADMLKNLKNGDVVSTSGGIVGTIVSVDTDTIVLRVKPDNLKLQFSRAAVSSVVLPEVQK